MPKGKNTALLYIGGFALMAITAGFAVFHLVISPKTPIGEYSFKPSGVVIRLWTQPKEPQLPPSPTEEIYCRITHNGQVIRESIGYREYYSDRPSTFTAVQSADETIVGVYGKLYTEYSDPPGSTSPLYNHFLVIYDTKTRMYLPPYDLPMPRLYERSKAFTEANPDFYTPAMMRVQKSAQKSTQNMIMELHQRLRENNPELPDWSSYRMAPGPWTPSDDLDPSTNTLDSETTSPTVPLEPVPSLPPSHP